MANKKQIAEIKKILEFFKLTCKKVKKIQINQICGLDLKIINK